ncbi:MAG: immunity 52 family protein [Alphaproteobacteria bacterium]|nr:immunity 52 family protein [Alphaproteobacteria bacterium]
MTAEPFRIEADWRSRPQSTRDCAVRLAGMLEGLASAHPAFARWNKQAWSRAAADRPAWAMPPDIDELTAVFEKGRQYKDAPREVWPEMGYSVSAWNGLDGSRGASLTVRPGSYANFSPFPNTIDVALKPANAGNADLVNSDILKPALLSMVTAWEPDCGGVICWDYCQRSFGDRHWPLFFSGWMTYLAPHHARLITPPPAAIVEPVPGGGLLLLATEDRFSMDNPAHLAVADAIQTALAPLQAIIPPSRNLPPRRTPAS